MNTGPSDMDPEGDAEGAELFSFAGEQPGTARSAP